MFALSLEDKRDTKLQNEDQGNSKLGGWYTTDLIEVFACVRPSRTIMAGANPNVEGTIYTIAETPEDLLKRKLLVRKEMKVQITIRT